MNLKETILKRIDEEITYEDGLGLKSIVEVINEVFEEYRVWQLALVDYEEQEIDTIQWHHDWLSENLITVNTYVFVDDTFTVREMHRINDEWLLQPLTN
jgi:hypothetical protein